MKEISNKLFQNTVANAIRLWATQHEAVDKFGDVTLSETYDDINEIAHFILKKVRKLTQEDK